MLPHPQIAQGVLLGLVLPNPLRGGQTADLLLDLGPRGLGVVRVEDAMPVRLEDGCACGRDLVSRPVGVEELVFHTLFL